MNDKNIDKRFEGQQNRSINTQDFEIREIDEENRTFEISFSSETPVERWGAYEVLSHKSGAVMLERINTTGCLLFNHNRDMILGKVIKAKINKKRGTATVQFADSEAAEPYYQLVKSGMLRGVSVGYVIHEMVRTVKGKGENAVTTYTATKWEPIEISIVSVPADITVGVGRSITDAAETPQRSLKMVDNLIQINNNKLRLSLKEVK